MQRTIAIGLLAAIMPFSTMASQGLTIEYKYTDATDNKIVSETVQADLANALEGGEPFYSEGMFKTIAVTNLANDIKDGIVAWSQTCNDIKKDESEETGPSAGGFKDAISFSTLPPVDPDSPIEPTKDLEWTDKCKAEKQIVINELKNSATRAETALLKIEAQNLARIKATAEENNLTFEMSRAQKMAREDKLRDHVERVNKLTQLMENDKPSRWSGKGFSDRSFAASSVAITTGGAQDARKYRDLVDGGLIPSPSDFQAYGFMNEFDLSLNSPCTKRICINPAVSYVPGEKERLYVQVGMGTNVTMENFYRPKLNLGLLIDISGSMISDDKTDRSRLEWAKKAANMTIDNLVAGEDYITVSTFTDQAKQIWPRADEPPKPISADDKDEIKQLIAGLETQSTTNLNDGLDLSYSNLSKVRHAIKSQVGYTHRLIMITDANLNVDPDEGGAVSKAEKMSETRGIDLTVIGVGLNFFQDFVERLTQVRGGNYIFAQNGQDMVEYFERFDFLVTPVAYDFVADLSFDEERFEFVKVHGVPSLGDEPQVDNVFNIKTLFFTSTENGGGARVLEFEIK